MKNIIDEKPSQDLKGRLRFTTRFVDDIDIEDKHLLDIGCGFGWFELNLLSRKVAQVTGMELSEIDLQTIKAHITDPKTAFCVGSAINIPFGENVFNTVSAWEVIEHIPKHTEDKMFFEIHRVLKDNGVLYLSTPYKHVVSCLFDPAWYFGHRHYSLKKLVNIAKRNGFVMEKCIVKGGIWEALSILNMYLSKWLFRREPILRHFFEAKAEEEYQNDRQGIYDVFIKFKKTTHV